MNHRAYYELTRADVGKVLIRAFGRTWQVSSFIGRALPQDVGKRCYLIGDCLQVENDAQLKERTGGGQAMRD